MSRKGKIVWERKIEIVQKYLCGKISITEAGRESGVDTETIRDWVQKYEAEGTTAFLRNRNKSYGAEIKMQAVTDYLGGCGSQRDICRKYGIQSKKQLRNWIKVYNAHGDFNSVKHSGGGSYMKKARSTTQEERLQIVKDCLESGRNYGEMALKYNVSYQQVRTWTLRFEELGEAGLEDRRGKRKKDQAPRTELERLQIEKKKLKHDLYMAEMERDLLKKVKELERRDALMGCGKGDTTEQ